MSEIRSQATHELVVPIHKHVCAANLEDCTGECYLAAAALQNAGWSKPRTVNSAAEFDALNPNAVCSFIDSNGITYAFTAAEWQMGGFFLTIKPFPMITVHTHAEST